MDTYDRIKELRKNLGLSQKAFGEKLGVSRSSINNIDSKAVPLKPLFIDHLCDVFNVNKEWLENGNGEMFLASSENIVEKLIREYKLDDMDGAIIRSYLILSGAERAAVKKYISSITNTMSDNLVNRNTLISKDITTTEKILESTSVKIDTK